MRNWSFPLGRVAGIPLEGHATFVLLLAVVVWHGAHEGGIAGAAWGGLLLLAMFGCIVLHELGHSLTARYYGVTVHSILLLPIGGVAQFDRIPREPDRELLITLAGPAVNFVIGGTLCLFLGFSLHWWHIGVPANGRELLQSLALWNLVIGGFNLLPIFPMDGGRILRAVLGLRASYLTATRISAHLGKVLAVAGAIYFTWETQSILPAFLFAFIFIGGDLEYRAVKRSEELAGLFINDVTRPRFLALDSRATISDALDLIALNRPQDILLFGTGRPVAVLPLDRIESATRPGYLGDPVLQHAQPCTVVLQADWPLETFHEAIAKRTQLLFPVYAQERLIGVVDARAYPETLRWLAQIRTARGDQI